LQAWARGCAIRRRAAAAVAAASERLRAAELHARANPSETLSRRMEDALWTLQNGTQLTRVVRACMALELSTRYSRVCCQVVAENAAPAVLVELIRNLNRSPPHQKILRLALMTLRNVARHGGQLAALVAAPEPLVGVFVDLLQAVRDRHESFVPAARLLAALAAAHA
ncbi:unnamed protein product, partial [Phaeothamnion confervicola]